MVNGVTRVTLAAQLRARGRAGIIQQQRILQQQSQRFKEEQRLKQLEAEKKRIATIPSVKTKISRASGGIVLLTPKEAEQVQKSVQESLQKEVLRIPANVTDKVRKAIAFGFNEFRREKFFAFEIALGKPDVRIKAVRKGEKVRAKTFGGKTAVELFEQARIERQIARKVGISPSPIVVRRRVRQATREGRALGDVRGTRLIEVGVAATRTERLKQNIKDNIPELKLLGKSDLSNLVRNVIGGVAGSEEFSKSEVSNLLSQAKDADGRFIFTQTEANKISNLVVEVGESFLIGGILGKAATLTRGALAKLTPKLIKESKKIQTAIKIGDAAILTGLTVVEGLSLNKTLKEEGQDAFLMQLIGDISFASGFAKTGLKPSKAAEKDIDNIIKTLKKASIKGKRGQVSVIKTRKKKGRFSELEELFVSKEEAETFKAVKGELEKRLVAQKDLKDRLRILAEIRKGIKTEEQKKGFQILLKELQEKNIISLPRVEIIPVKKTASIKEPKVVKLQDIERLRVPVKIKPEEEFLAPVGIQRAIGGAGLTDAQLEKVKGGQFDVVVETIRHPQDLSSASPRLRNELRTQLNQQKNQLISSIQKQKNLISQLSTQRASQLEIQRAKQKLNELTKQRTQLSTKQRQKMQQLTKQLEKQRQKLSLQTKTRLASRQKALEKQRLKQKFRFRRRLKKKFKVPKPFGLPRLKPGQKRKLRRKLIKRKTKFDIFVRKKGKDIRIGGSSKLRLARRRLKKRLNVSLRASGFIVDRKTQKKVKPKITAGFRKSKIDPFRLVERRSRRLDTGRETRAIQEAKRSKLKKVKPLIRRKKKK